MIHVLKIPNTYPLDFENSPYNHDRNRDKALSTNKDIKVGFIALRTLGCQKIIFNNIWSAKGLEVIQDGKISGILNTKCNSLFGLNIPRQVFLIPLMNSAFREYVKLYGMPNVIHGHRIKTGGYMAYYLAKKFKIPYVITEHSSDYISKKVNNSTKEYERIVNSAARLCSVSNFLSKELESIFKNSRGRWINTPNVIPTFFEKNKCNRIRNTEEYIILSIGTLDENKGQEKIIKALRILKDKNIRIRLDVVGEGEKLNELIKITNENNLKNKVVFHGAQSQKYIFNLMKNTSFLAVTSLYETFSIVTIEALSQGIPVLSTPCGGPEEIIKKNINGVITKGFDEYSISDGILEMIEKMHLFKQDALINDSVKKYGALSYSNTHYKLYEEVYSER